jgi:hypothetical protein
MLAVIWKFFLASVLAAVATFLIVRAIPQLTTPVGALGAFARMVSVSLIFFGLYFAGVIALHNGLKPLSETVGLFRDLLPERSVRPAYPTGVDSEGALAVPTWGPIVESQTDSTADSDFKPRGV